MRARHSRRSGHRVAFGKSFLRLCHAVATPPLCLRGDVSNIPGINHLYSDYPLMLMLLEWSIAIDEDGLSLRCVLLMLEVGAFVGGCAGRSRSAFARVAYRGNSPDASIFRFEHVLHQAGMDRHKRVCPVVKNLASVTAVSILSGCFLSLRGDKTRACSCAGRQVQHLSKQNGFRTRAFVSTPIWLFPFAVARVVASRGRFFNRTDSVALTSQRAMCESDVIHISFSSTVHAHGQRLGFARMRAPSQQMGWINFELNQQRKE